MEKWTHGTIYNTHRSKIQQGKKIKRVVRRCHFRGSSENFLDEVITEQELKDVSEKCGCLGEVSGGRTW